jgi:glycine/D-amino acid oxidase-like deaminating enzyme
LKSGLRIAVAGAGVYGSTIALRLAGEGHRVTLYDPLGVLRAASAINQCRIHAGYHYPRSPETIAETLQARAEFLSTFAPAVVRGTRHYYAIPREGSRTSPAAYEQVLDRHGLPYRRVSPRWMDSGFIEACYEVEESLYDPALLRRLLVRRLAAAGVAQVRRRLGSADERRYDRVVYATYGIAGGRPLLFERVQLQVAEKVLVDLPASLRRVSLVVIDGPFTAFDPYGRGPRSLFGSALHTNHWKVFDPARAVPPRYRRLLNGSGFRPVAFTHFEAMRRDAALAVPLVARARYVGSRFTLRLVEHDPKGDRRILRVVSRGKQIHVFSAKVVSATKAARLVAEMVRHG